MLDKTLTAIEKKIMMTIWNTDHRMALKEIVEQVNKRYKKEWKPQTISTYLAHLVQKKYLSMERQGRIFLYTAEKQQETFVENEAHDFYEYYDFYDLMDFIKAMNESGCIKKADLEEMKAVLDHADA